LFDWFELSLPLTSDKIRMTASDDVIEAAAKSIPECEAKWAFEV
jgi:hypothetical protein